MSDISPILRNRIIRLNCNILHSALQRVPSLTCVAEFWENVEIETDITELKGDVLRAISQIAFRSFEMDVQARVSLYLDGSENASGCVDILFPEGLKEGTLVSFSVLYDMSGNVMTLSRERGDII